ncbi:MAG: hypothetical protein MRY76_00405 [Pseudomonadales bacterium]|nr:hypothetical protein [Pseudomonadales bacterium]
MKNILLKTTLAFTFLLSVSAAQAQIFPALTIFNGETGKLQIPTLVYNGNLYYLELSVADAAALTMKIEESSLVDITPGDELSGNVADNIVGTWDVAGENSQLTFVADATWQFSQAAGVDEESCPEGGIESGTFRYTPGTGVLILFFEVDENGDCGLSSAGGVVRLIPDGNNMTLMIGTEVGAELTLTN